MEPQKHSFTITDTTKVINLGYRIDKTSSLSFEDFMSAEFPDFNLAKLLEEVETVFTPTTTLDIERTIYYQDTPPKLRILLENKRTGLNDALIFDREFFKSAKGIEINHSWCVVPEDHQGKGLIKSIFQASLQEYVNMHAQKIHVHAGLTIGGHSWARHGFVAINPDEVQTILDDAQAKLDPAEFTVAKRIFDKYYTENPGGKAFPMIFWAKLDFMKDILKGSDWWREVDLTNSEQFSNFRNYVFRK